MNLYRTVEEYQLVAETLSAVCGVVLLSFAKHECTQSDIILRNFLAKSSMSLKGIFSLWEINNFQDCWTIYRTQLDRLFHLEHIATNNEFELFDDWSLYEKAKKQNLVKSDQRFSGEAKSMGYVFGEELQSRIKNLLKEKPVWKRPKAEKVAKKMGLDFLYKFGYDMASMHVHPMSNDGQEDYYSLTGIEASEDFPSQITVLHNSILVTSMMLQNVINFSSFSWRTILWSFAEEVRDLINTGSTEYQLSYAKIANDFSLKVEFCKTNA